MKVAVVAEEPDCNSPLDTHFARARYYLVVDLGNGISAIRNNTHAERIRYLAGTQTAGSLISLGIDAVITMNIGPKAFATFHSAGVRVYRAVSGTVEDALGLLVSGQLAEFVGPNVAENWQQNTLL